MPLHVVCVRVCVCDCANYLADIPDKLLRATEEITDTQDEHGAEGKHCDHEFGNTGRVPGLFRASAVARSLRRREHQEL